MIRIFKENQGIELEFCDKKFYLTLKKILYGWYRIDINDLPEIFSSLAIDDGKYFVEKNSVELSYVSLNIQSTKIKQTVIIYRGNVISSFPHFLIKVCPNDDK